MYSPFKNLLTPNDFIGSLTSIIMLDVRDFQLTQLPDSIQNLTSLVYLAVNHNKIGLI